MSAFHDLNGLPASGSKWLLTDVLRTQMGFKGFVVSDWAAVEQLVVQGVVKDKKEAGELAINAGLDMDMTDGVYNAYLEQSVKEGIVSEEVIDESVRRILRAKYRLAFLRIRTDSSATSAKTGKSRAAGLWSSRVTWRASPSFF